MSGFFDVYVYVYVAMRVRASRLLTFLCELLVPGPLLPGGVSPTDIYHDVLAGKYTVIS